MIVHQHNLVPVPRRPLLNTDNIPSLLLRRYVHETKTHPPPAVRLRQRDRAGGIASGSRLLFDTGSIIAIIGWKRSYPVVGIKAPLRLYSLSAPALQLQHTLSAYSLPAARSSLQRMSSSVSVLGILAPYPRPTSSHTSQNTDSPPLALLLLQVSSGSNHHPSTVRFTSVLGGGRGVRLGSYWKNTQASF